jgi:hypothetical protein
MARPNLSYDATKADPMSISVEPVAPEDFDIVRYADYAAEADQRYADFLARQDGVAVWQRVRVGPVFRNGCRDMGESLRWQLGGLAKSLAYLTDAPTYLEPWYGIGTTASAFGATYYWPPDQAPVTQHPWNSVSEVPNLAPLPFDQVPIMCHTLQMIEYFLDFSQGRLPISWCDLQAPINVVAGGLVDISQFLIAFYDAPDRVKELLQAAASVIIDFTQRQSQLIGNALAQPGHGFASSRRGTGIGLSSDNLIMIAPAMYRQFCAPVVSTVGDHFGGVAIHSCGDWGRWLEAVKTISNLRMVDGAFSPQTDPAYNKCEIFRDALVGTGITLHARIVGAPDEVLIRVKRLWKPGLHLIVGTHVQDPAAQRQLYHDIHALCS